MEVYEIHLTGGGFRCILKGPLGAVEEVKMDNAREASLHAQFCAQGGEEALLRVFRQDGTLESERPIPPVYPGHGNATKDYWGWFEQRAAAQKCSPLLRGFPAHGSQTG